MEVTKEFWSNDEFGISVAGFSVENHWSPCCRRRRDYAPFEPTNLYFCGVARETKLPFSASVVLGEISGREYERITNTLFNEFITNVMRTYYRKNRASPSQKWRIRTYCHICEKIARFLHRCDKFVRIFSHLWQIRLTFTFKRTCQTFEECARICHTSEKFELILHRCDKYVRILHTSKIRHLWKTRIYSNLKTCRTYISHRPNCDVFVRIIHSVWKIRSVNIKVQHGILLWSYSWSSIRIEGLSS